MVHGFVKQSGGHLKIYSEPGQGTTVKVYLPRLIASEWATSTEGPKERPAGPSAEAGPKEPASGTILVIEDDEGVLAFEREILAAEGYKVLVARDSVEAMRVIESDVPIDLILTDVVLPGGMNGRHIADAAKRLRPEVPVLYTTGYTINAIVHHGRLDSDIELLSKPFSSENLIAAVARMLKSPGRS
jgi:CheY-like chemotaxis protein